jgi:hypothetical protein
MTARPLIAAHVRARLGHDRGTGTVGLPLPSISAFTGIVTLRRFIAKFAKFAKPVASNFNGLAVWPDARNGFYFANVTMPPHALGVSGCQRAPGGMRAGLGSAADNSHAWVEANCSIWVTPCQEIEPSALLARLIKGHPTGHSSPQEKRMARRRGLLSWVNSVNIGLGSNMIGRRWPF